MNSKLLLTALVLATTGLLLDTAYVIPVTGCMFKLLSKPETSYYPFLDNHRYPLKCVFRSYCRPILSFDYNPNIDDSIYRPIYSSYYRKEKGLSYQTKLSVSGTSYTATLIIDPFKSHYAGKYRCNIASAKNPSYKLSGTFRVGVVELSPLPVYPQCFLPKVRSINISLSSDPMGILIQWQLTENEDHEIKDCINSRHWRVRLLSFSSAQTAPVDKDIVNDNSVQWTNVSNMATEYFFPQPVSSHLYYSFQVVHRGDFNPRQVYEFDINPITFASYLYYFGEQVPANIRKPPNSIVRLPYGSTSSIHCDARGLPAPNVKWIKESSSNSVPTVRLNNSAVLELNHVTEDDAGIYYCLAFNTLVNPPKGRRNEADTWQITVIIEEKTTGLSCHFLSIDSSICKSYIHTDLQRIFTNHTTNETSIEREDRAIQLTADINYHIPLGTCRDLAHSMMCHNVYPYCNVAPSLPTPRKLCNKVCQEFLTGKCQGHVPKTSSLYKILVEGCDSREYTGGQSPECIPLSYQAYRNDQVEPIEDTGDCVRGDGRGYSGNIYRTQSGAFCQSWTHQKPHPHPMLPEMYRSDLDQAHFSCRNPGGVGSRPWCYTNDPAVRWEYCTAIPQCDSCELYSGDMCTHLAVYSNINVNVRRSRFLQSQDIIEEKMYLFYRSVLFLQPTEGCKDILRVLLCQGAFPQCTETATKRLCSDYCQFNQTLREHCPNVFEEFSEFVAVNGHFMNTPDCTVENGDQCMAVARLGTPLIQGSINSMKRECYDNFSGYYNGTAHVTQNKLICQAWNLQTPHSHPFTPEKYPELENANNYCRNPGNLQVMPWCYTTDLTKIWDYCNIRPCNVNNNIPLIQQPTTTFIQPSNTSIPAENTVAPSVIFGIVAVTFVAIFFLLLCCAIVACYCVSFRNRKERAKTVLCQVTQDPIKDGRYSTNNNYPVIAPLQSESLSIPENFTLLDGKNIKYVCQLGQGNFGIVFKGRAFDLKKGGEEEGIDVAVKMLKEEATSEVKQDFIDEAKLMFTFDHPNILKIHGVCMSEMPYQLVFEYMDEGDLTKFLRSRASSQQRRLINPFSYRSRTESSYSDDPPSLTKTELLYICKQIAAGMNYLSENNHVHRDLACRNCLIKSDLVVKIGDFGMSKNLYSKDYYRINGKAVLPVRWMSPESLIYGKFSIEGDVWSFGVVMWEVFSFALQPYYGITNEQVIEVVRKGRTLRRPDNCPEEIYKIMKECWEMDPADRPAFSELYNLLYGQHHLYSVSSVSPDKELRECDSSDVSSNAFYSEEDLEENCV